MISRRRSPDQRRRATVRRTVASLCMIGCVVMILATPVRAQSPQLDEDRLMILELRLGKLLLSEGLLAYGSEAGVLVPLGTVCDLLEFAIDVDPPLGRAGGWFQAESRVFSLDVASGRVSSEGAATQLPPGGAVAGDDDVYVLASLLGDWFPISMEIHAGQLDARIRATEDMPVERRLRREEARDTRLAALRADATFPVEKAEYGTFTWPLLDINAEYRGRGDDMAARVNVQSAGDVGGLGTQVFVAHDGGPRIVETARVTAGRTDPEGGLLGPLGATRVEFGDLYAPSLPLVLRGKLGRGMTLGNHALRRPDRYDATEVAGDGTPGWEVELYANGALLDFGEVDDNGRFLFEDVPLAFGRNEFRTVLYGPQGQTREQIRVVTVGGEMIPAGQFSWRVFTLQDDRFLITGDDLLADSPDRGRWTTHAEVGTGVGKRLSLLAGLTRQPLEGVDRTYRSLTAQSVVRGLHVQGGLVSDAGGGSATLLGAQGQVLGRTLTFSHEMFAGFRSDANDRSQSRTRETRMRLGGHGRWSGRPLAYDLKIQTTGFEERGIDRQDHAELRAATSLDKVMVSSRLGYRRTASILGGYTQTYWEQLGSGHWGPVLLRGSLRTRFSPDATLEALTGSAAWHPVPSLRLGARLQHNFAADGATTLGGSLSLLRDSYQLSLNVHDSSTQPAFVSLAVTTSFTKIPERQTFHVQRQRMSTGYGATANVFLDRNGNGIFDDRDDPLEGVRLSGGGGGADTVTDAHGRTYLGGLPAHRERDVMLDVDTLADPYLLPVVPGRTAVGHPGGHVILDFPVTFAGDVEGTLWVRTPTGRQPLRGIKLELVDLSQQTIRTTISEFDGYYLFQEVPPGWYEVRITEDSLQRRHLRPTAPVAVAVPPDGGVSGGNDFTLRFVSERQAGR